MALTAFFFLEAWHGMPILAERLSRETIDSCRISVRIEVPTARYPSGNSKCQDLIYD